MVLYTYGYPILFKNPALDLLLLWHPISVRFCLLFVLSVDVVICMLQSVPIASKLNISPCSLRLDE